MRVLMLLKGPGSEEGMTEPTAEMYEAMTSYNEKLVSAGVMLGGEGLHPTSEARKVVFDAGNVSVVKGPFRDEDIVHGYWILDVPSLDVAEKWARRCPADPDSPHLRLELREMQEMTDLDGEFPPDILARERRLAEELRTRHD